MQFSYAIYYIEAVDGNRCFEVMVINIGCIFDIKYHQ